MIPRPSCVTGSIGVCLPKIPISTPVKGLSFVSEKGTFAGDLPTIFSTAKHQVKNLSESAISNNRNAHLICQDQHIPETQDKSSHPSRYPVPSSRGHGSETQRRMSPRWWSRGQKPKQLQDLETWSSLSVDFKIGQDVFGFEIPDTRDEEGVWWQVWDEVWV